MGFADSDQAMEAFIGWTETLGLQLYPHQEEAILEIFSGNHLIINTPTGSGKSLIATAMIFKCFAECGVAYMTAPIKALVSEKFFSLCRTFGAENVGMMTGDGAVNRDAPIIVCTAEILSNLSLREGEDTKVNAVIMDEFHYYGDRDRGMAWQVPLLTLPQARFVLMSATLGDTSAISDRIERRTGHEVALISGADRPIPLSFEWSEKAIHDAIHDLIHKGKAPVYIVHFSQREATERAQAMLSLDIADKEQKAALKKSLKGVRFDSTFGKTIRRYLLHGVGLHHAGLLPRYRTAVEQLAQKGLLKVICGTDTLGVGINVPIRTVLFTKLSKYDGRKQRILTVRDFHQIAGRAGRAGFDTEGLVIAQAPEHVIENKKLRDKAAAGNKKVKLRKPPERGYVHYDKNTFQQLIQRPPEELKSRFRLDHGTLLTLLQNADAKCGDAGAGLEMLEQLIELAHLSNNGRERVRTRTTELLSELIEAGVVGWVPSPEAPNRTLTLDEGLQDDFSLHHSLSLFLVETMVRLKPEDPEFVLDTITLTEAVLEDPMVVLYALRNKAKSIAITQMKADGIPYEERMEALEEISWPQPKREWLHQQFDAYAANHPWVIGRELHPKSIVRAMFGEYRSFNGWVKEHQLERSEGVLLRYLSEAYKALIQNIPADDRTEELWAAIAWLRSVVHRADSSLVEEWERMAFGPEASDETEGPQVVDISADPRAFKARVRADLHAFVRALANGDYEEALLLIRPLEGTQTWSSVSLEAALCPYIEQYGGITFNHRARMSEHTVMGLEEPHRWRVTQTLIDEPAAPLHDLEELAEPDNATFLHCVVDLRDNTDPSGPVLTLLKVAGA